jgi:hypothetical protein
MSQLVDEGASTTPSQPPSNKGCSHHTPVENRVAYVRIIRIPCYSAAVVAIPEKAADSRDNPDIEVAVAGPAGGLLHGVLIGNAQARAAPAKRRLIIPPVDDARGSISLWVLGGKLKGNPCIGSPRCVSDRLGQSQKIFKEPLHLVFYHRGRQTIGPPTVNDVKDDGNSIGRPLAGVLR